MAVLTKSATGGQIDPWYVSRSDAALGTLKSKAVRDGLGMVMADLTYQKDAEYQYYGNDYLKLQFKLSGLCSISGESGEVFPVESDRIAIVVQHRDCKKFEQIPAKTHSRSVTLACGREFISSLMNESEITIPSYFSDFIRDQVNGFAFYSRPLPLELRAVTENIMQSRLQGKIGDLMLEGKALELLSLAIDHLMNASDLSQDVSPKEFRKVMELRDYLEAHPASMLDTAGLCRLVAWNQTQMMACFKRVIGTTISEYRHLIRMERARKELAESNLTITDIAIDAGYDHPSNFSTAFKRTFGIAPKHARAANFSSIVRR